MHLLLAQYLRRQVYYGSIIYATNQHVYIDKRHKSSDSNTNADLNIGLPVHMALPDKTAV